MHNFAKWTYCFCYSSLLCYLSLSPFKPFWSFAYNFLNEYPVFEQVAKNAVRGLWARRSKINLVGAHIDVFTGEWTQKVILSYTNNLVIVLSISLIFIENLVMLDLWCHFHKFSNWLWVIVYYSANLLYIPDVKFQHSIHQRYSRFEFPIGESQGDKYVNGVFSYRSWLVFFIFYFLFFIFLSTTGSITM